MTETSPRFNSGATSSGEARVFVGVRADRWGSVGKRGEWTARINSVCHGSHNDLGLALEQEQLAHTATISTQNFSSCSNL